MGPVGLTLIIVEGFLGPEENATRELSVGGEIRIDFIFLFEHSPVFHKEHVFLFLYQKKIFF